MEQANDKSILDCIDNLTIVVRDCDLSQEIISKYKKGMILKEPVFCEANYVLGGFPCNARFAIFSNRFKEFSTIDKVKGICFTDMISRFKVLDIIKGENKTEIVLLHLPNDERWKNFRDLTYIVEQRIVQIAKRNFDTLVLAEPVSELSTKEILSKFSRPLGMDENMNFVDIN